MTPHRMRCRNATASHAPWPCGSVAQSTPSRRSVDVVCLAYHFPPRLCPPAACLCPADQATHPHEHRTLVPAPLGHPAAVVGAADPMAVVPSFGGLRINHLDVVCAEFDHGTPSPALGVRRPWQCPWYIEPMRQPGTWEGIFSQAVTAPCQRAVHNRPSGGLLSATLCGRDLHARRD